MKLMPISKQRSKACRSPDMIRIAITQAAFDRSPRRFRGGPQLNELVPVYR